MAFTLYKLSLKLLPSVADPEFSKKGGGADSIVFVFPIFCKLTNKQKGFWFLKGDGPLAPPLDPPLKFF
jgi:hypothetical protein